MMHAPQILRAAPVRVEESRPATVQWGTGGGIDDRVRGMFAALTISVMDPWTQEEAYRAVAGCPQDDHECILSSAFRWVKSKVTYRGELAGVDTYKSARRTLDVGAGDCDCFAICIDAINACNGYHVGTRIIHQRDDDGSELWHAYALAFMGDIRIPYDATVPHFGPGDEVDPRYVVESFDFLYHPQQWVRWKLSGGSLADAPQPKPLRPRK